MKLVKTLPETLVDGTTEPPKTEIHIKVDNFEEGYYFTLEEDPFQERVFEMREMINEYFDSGVIPARPKQEDPFWGPPEP